MRKFLALLLGLAILVPATAQAASQYAKLTCTPATSGAAPTSVTVERSVANSGTWATVGGPFALPSTPPSFTDTTRVSGTSYQYRCLFTASGGSTPTDPTVATTFVDNVGVPGKGTIDLIIITQ
jgi:hypothetical protein